jgi:hypothetical protein
MHINGRTRCRADMVHVMASKLSTMADSVELELSGTHLMIEGLLSP